MVRFFPCHFFRSSRRVNAIVLAFALGLGYLLGGICAHSPNPDLFLLMRTGAETRVSIVCLIPVLFLPFLGSVFAVYIGLNWLLVLVAFFKAFLFSFLCGNIWTLFPNAGFLFSALFLFTDFLSMPVLCWFWLRCACGCEMKDRALIPVVMIMAGIGILDYQVVSPFLASLLS